MKHTFIKTGKIVSTHGVRGMVRVEPWCDSGEFLCKFKKLYKDEGGNEMLEILSASVHGNVVLLKIKSVDTKEDAEKLRNTVLYIDRNDCVLEKGKYFISDIINSTLVDFETNETLGVLKNVLQYKANDVWEIVKDDKTYLFPAVEEYIKDVDIDKEIIKIKKLEGVFYNED